jgi:hypothetical protein
MKKSDLRKMIQEEYEEVLKEQKLREGLLSWASGVADNIVYSVLNNYKDVRSSQIYADPKLQKLAKDLKIDQKELQSRVNTLLRRDNKFLKALATQKAKYI